jgi:hypothetical protein
MQSDPDESSLMIKYLFQTSVNWNDVTLNVESTSDEFSPYSCNGNAPITNQSFVLTATASSSSTAMNFGDSCLVEGPYKITLQFPSARGRALTDSVALIDSVSTIKKRSMISITSYRE